MVVPTIFVYQNKLLKKKRCSIADMPKNHPLQCVDTSECPPFSLPSDTPLSSMLDTSIRESPGSISPLPFQPLCLLSKIMCSSTSLPSCSLIYSHIALFTLALHGILFTFLVEDSIFQRGMNSFVWEKGEGKQGLKKPIHVNLLYHLPFQDICSAYCQNREGMQGMVANLFAFQIS